jgi:hypothetical protein
MEARMPSGAGWRGDTDFELGKTEILAYWRKTLRCYGLDEGHLAYRWESSPSRGTWSLTTSNESTRHELTFAEEDVRGWPNQPHLLGKYLLVIQGVLDRLLDQDPEQVR